MCRVGGPLVSLRVLGVCRSDVDDFVRFVHSIHPYDEAAKEVRRGEEPRDKKMSRYLGWCSSKKSVT